MGYWSTMGIILWGFGGALGVLFFASSYGLPGMFAWLGLNLLVGYRLSKARKHWKKDVFDDKLTEERMLDAEEELVKKWKKHR